MSHLSGKFARISFDRCNAAALKVSSSRPQVIAQKAKVSIKSFQMSSDGQIVMERFFFIRLKDNITFSFYNKRGSNLITL